MSRGFWSEYFGMKNGGIPDRPGLVIEHLNILAECNRRWNPNYREDHFRPAKESKRKARLVRMYWAMKRCGR